MKTEKIKIVTWGWIAPSSTANKVSDELVTSRPPQGRVTLAPTGWFPVKRGRFALWLTTYWSPVFLSTSRPPAGRGWKKEEHQVSSVFIRTSLSLSGKVLPIWSQNKRRAASQILCFWLLTGQFSSYWLLIIKFPTKQVYSTLHFRISS